MNKRERLEKTIAGEETDRVPVTLGRHWPGDDQRAADLARALVDFQKSYDWDFVQVAPANSYCVADYGAQNEWRGALDGKRVFTRRAVKRSLDWTELRPLDPLRGELGKQLECLRLVGDGLRGDETPIVQVIYSPLDQAGMLSGNELFIRNMRTHPDRLRTGLNIITESTLRFIEAMKRTPISGILYMIEHASYSVMSEEEYLAFGVPYDLKVLDALPNIWWLNVVQIRGNAPMLKLFGDYPAQVFNWEDRDARPDLAQGKTIVQGGVCGGLSAWHHVHQGTPATIRDVARETMAQTHSRRLILSTGNLIPVTSPLSNIRAVREIVEEVRM